MAAHFPAYSLRTPLNKGFPTGKSSSPTKQNSAGGSRPTSGSVVVGSTRKSAVDEEYVRNLQQQIYLLELETRYLRAPQSEHMDPSTAPGGQQQRHHNFQDISAQAAPLNDTLKNLKYKYVELQEQHKAEHKKLEDGMSQLKTEYNLQTIILQNSEKERSEMADAIGQIKQHHISEKDKLYGEALSLRKKLQSSQSDLSRMELHYQRVNSERQKLASEGASSSAAAKKSAIQIEEQLGINGALKGRVEEFRRENTLLRSEVEEVHATYATYDLDAQRTHVCQLQKEIVGLRSGVAIAETRQQQEAALRHRAMEDCSELVRSNVALKSELEEVQARLRREFEQRETKLRHKQDRLKDFEVAREELGRLRDDLQMGRISNETKDSKIHEIVQKNKSIKSALTKALDTQRVLEDRIIDLENRIRIGESEVIQLGQDKSLLIDDVGELRNSTEIQTGKVRGLVCEKQELQVLVAKYEREMSARKEFSQMIQELEHSGENYLGLMRNMKCLISATGGDGVGVNDGGGENPFSGE